MYLVMKVPLTQSKTGFIYRDYLRHQLLWKLQKTYESETSAASHWDITDKTLFPH